MTNNTETIKRFRNKFHHYEAQNPRHVVVNDSSGYFEDFISQEISQARQEGYEKGIVEAHKKFSDTVEPYKTWVIDAKKIRQEERNLVLELVKEEVGKINSFSLKLKNLNLLEAKTLELIDIDDISTLVDSLKIK